MSELLPRFIRYVQAHGLVRAGDCVLVAVSGGVDSVVLLQLFRLAAHDLGITVRAAHFDHAMRSNSAADAEFVTDLCDSWQIPLTQARATHVLESEAAAREARYTFLYNAASENECSRIATAHHADDQVETVLFRLLRGAGLRGLAGIPLRRDCVIRPLLRFHKEELTAYAAENEIAFREDPSNQELQFSRNRIRQTVIPALESVQRDAARSVLALARYAARTERAWAHALEHLEKEVVAVRESHAIELARPMLLGYHADLRNRVIRHLLRGFGVVPGRAQTRHIVEFLENAQSGAALLLPRHVRLERRFDTIRIEREHEGISDDVFLDITGTDGCSEVSLGGRSYVVEWKTRPGVHDGGEAFALGATHPPLEVRAWRAGDRIRLPYGTKKLKKLFGEHRVPASERGTVPVVADANGRVLWVVGIARSVDAVPGENETALNITVKNA